MNIEHTKEGITKQIEKVEGLAGEIRVRLHLATLDLKKEWDEKLEPRLMDLKSAPMEKLHELGSQLEGFLGRFRKDEDVPSKA